MDSGIRGKKDRAPDKTTGWKRHLINDLVNVGSRTSAALNWSDARRNDTIASQPKNKNGTTIVEIKYSL